MKTFKVVYLLPVACLAGYLAGSWSAQDELREYKAQPKEQAPGVKAESPLKPDGISSFTKMANIPDKAEPVRHKPKNVPPPEKPSFAVTNRVEETPPSDEPYQHHPVNPEDLRERIEQARDLWATRADIVRAQWVSTLQLSGDNEAAFGESLQEMNDKLYDSVAEIADILAAGGEMTPELGLRLMGETNAALVEAYDRIAELVSPELRDTVSTINELEFIDPGVAEPLINVQDKLSHFSMSPGGVN